ncbi:MAG: hypothetical protein GY850_00610 [bacterium]|nr:hypothetical protein [bacterium]
MKKSRRVFIYCLVVACCVFLTNVNLYAAESYWPCTIDRVIVRTTPTTEYSLRVTHATGGWKIKLYFTSKEMLATALTIKAMDTTARIVYETTTDELLQINFE